MTLEQMKSKLTTELEFWHKQKLNWDPLDSRIEARMDGMIQLAFEIGIINKEEKFKLNYIYMGIEL